MPQVPPDLDDTFAYETQKVVLIRDRRVGMIHRGIQAFITLIVIGIQLIYMEGYMAREINTGFINGIIPFDFGKVYSGYSQDGDSLRAWDSADLVAPANEVGGMFVTTKLAITKEQAPGECANPKHKCSGDADCKNKPPLFLGACDGGKGCKEFMWCPPEDPDGKKGTVVHQIEGIEKFVCWFKAVIMFPTLNKEKKFDTMDGKGPKLGDNAFTIKEILSKAGTTYDEIKADGCVIAVKLKWSCPMASKKCPHELDVKRLDPKDDPVAKGFNFKQAFYYYKGEMLVRDEWTRYGIRMLLSSEGEGRQTDLAQTMLLVSSALALIKIADAAADGLIISVLKHKHLYAQCKFETTDDFSDLQDRVYLITGEDV